MAQPEEKTVTMSVCTYCKDQIKEEEVDKHAQECALIPEKDRARVAARDEAVEELEVDQHAKGK